MYKIGKIWLLAICCFSLSACETLRWPRTQPDPIAVEQIGDLRPLYAESTRHVADGSVQLFSLDAPHQSPIGGARPSAPRDSGGIPYSRDNNVMVYSLGQDQQPRSDDGVVRPGWMTYDGAGGGYDRSGIAAGEPTRVFFSHGSSRIDASGHDAIDSALRRGPGVDGFIRVEGHASTRAETHDPVERRIVNLRMSMKRAMAVSEALIRKGIPAPRIKATAWGDTQPAISISGMSDEAAARRVDILTSPY